MKKRRTLIISLLLIAALALGVGYAAVSQSLAWEFTFENDKIDFVVHFINVTESAVSAANDDDVVARILDLSDGGTTGGATINPMVDGLSVVGDSVTFTYTVQNDSSIMVELKELTHNFTNDYFEVTTGAWEKTILDVGETTTVDITVSLKEVSNQIERGSFEITAEVVPYVAP